MSLTSTSAPDRKFSKQEAKEKLLTEKSPEQWSTSDSKKLFLVQKWGEGYFDINDKGNLCARPNKALPKGPVIDIKEVLDEVKSRGIELPIVIRFQDILRSRVVEINKIFRETIAEANYRGDYFGVYPIKVNQMREVVEEIVDAGKPYHYGLEAGSKPELMAVLSMPLDEKCLTILNGYKDEDYLRLALLGIKMGRQMVIVIEKFSEIPMLITIAEEMKVEPIVGFRAKLASKGAGKWAASSGDKAKFGLTIPEIVQAIELLKSQNKHHWIKLFHFHIGSQIPDIKTLKDALTEGARIYCKMAKMGVPLTYFDVGGGAGVNYLGSTSNNSEISINYSLKDYVADVVYIMKQICDLESVDHPHLVTESGRTVTAFHSCIITNVFGSIKQLEHIQNTDKKTGEHIIVTNMRDLYNELQKHNVVEIYNDALIKKEETISAFKLGVLDLEERGKSETLFNMIIKKIMELEDKDAEEKSLDLEMLQNHYCSQYLCNFSVFQSAPDTWGIGQILPILPISRLNQKPTVRATMADITCDSDGKIDSFLSMGGIRRTTYFHAIKSNHEATDEYHVGIFLTGAYQDIMGDMHNLFGRLNEVHVYLDDEDPTDFYIEEFIPGNSAQQVLATLQYSPQQMAKSVKSVIDTQVKRGKLRPREGVELCDYYDKCLGSYTYLK